MKTNTLFVSDLDGTLLNSEQKISEFTAKVINELTKKGINFTYATARSIITAKKATDGIDVSLPVIVHNGSFIVDSLSQKRLLCNFFDSDESAELINDLLCCEIYPIVYAILQDQEKFMYLDDKINSVTRDFINTRIDYRNTPVYKNEELLKGERYYITCIGEAEKLRYFYAKYSDKFNCMFYRELYTGEYWLEILPKGVSKSSAVLQLKNYLGCDRIVSFGDAANDIAMFEISDECYAVENADEKLKKIATGVIGHHDSDAVAKWLLNNT